jgi:hypothetical protein
VPKELQNRGGELVLALPHSKLCGNVKRLFEGERAGRFSGNLADTPMRS